MEELVPWALQEEPEGLERAQNLHNLTHLNWRGLHTKYILSL